LRKYAQEVGSGQLCSELKIKEKGPVSESCGLLNKMTDDLRSGLIKVAGVSQKLDGLIDQLSDSSNKEELLLKEDIKKIVSELKSDKQDLKKALGYLKLRNRNCNRMTKDVW